MIVWLNDEVSAAYGFQQDFMSKHPDAVAAIPECGVSATSIL